MARPGAARPHKVLSSGRLTGSSKLASGGKRVALRKVVHSDVDCGYSLYSTDSEDQVTTIHHGLDRCAALLKDILQNESEDGMETLYRKAGKAPVVRAASRPLANKGSGARKRVPKKKTLSANVHKEIGPVSDRKPVPVAASAVEKGTASVGTEQALLIRTAPVPGTHHSPVIHQKLCEHVQTQMALLNVQPPQKANEKPEAQVSVMPENASYQPITAFNSRLPTSTPALSPQQATSSEGIQPVVSAASCGQCASQMGHVFSSAPCIISNSAPQGQPVAACSALTHMIPCAPNDPTPSTVLPPPVSREAASAQGSHEQLFEEADLIRCIQAHLAALQAHEEKNRKANEKYQETDALQPQPLNSRGEENTESCSEGSLGEEENLDGVDVAPVRDTSCQTSFDKERLKPKKPSLQKTTQKIKTVKYLLGELKALLRDHEDSEILRLLVEAEDHVSLMPEADGNINVQAEIALAVQPLRSENAQLRRRLRILNQQLKDQERAEKEYNFDSNFEFVSLQALNKALQQQLNESMKGIELLQKKNEEVTQLLENQREENKRLNRIIYEREQELLEKKQQYDIESTKLKMEADEVLTNLKSVQYKLEVAEKENQILGITLRQRDAEVNRLCELTRALQGSMSRLLADLTVDTAKPKQERSLSKALLEIHEKQLQSDAYPLSDSIMSYLKRLETGLAPIIAEPLLSKSERKASNPGGDIQATEQPPPKSPVVVEEIVAPKTVFTFLKPDVEGASNASTLVEGLEPDETIYIPLSSSPSRKPAAAMERRAGGQQQQHPLPRKVDRDAGLVDGKQASQFGVMGGVNVSDKFCGSCGPKMTVERKAETMGRPAKLEGRELQRQPKEIANGAAKVISDNPDRLHPDKFLHTPVAHQKGNVQGKGPGISAPDSSFSAFDWMSGKSDWTFSSFSTFTSRDEEDFKNGLAALDANIARLQRTLQDSLKKNASP
nr:coiled-coil domain-containing protein 14 [Pogona vitticeps]